MYSLVNESLRGFFVGIPDGYPKDIGKGQGKRIIRFLGSSQNPGGLGF
jgi:hypothetical protein